MRRQDLKRNTCFDTSALAGAGAIRSAPAQGQSGHRSVALTAAIKLAEQQRRDSANGTGIGLAD
jgi:hypothetical protein